MSIPTELALHLYRMMLRIRLTEEEVAARYAQQEMRCPVHLCIGQEGIAAGVCAALERHDKVFSNHRAHGHFMAKGGDMGRMIAEFYGRSGGCCGGRGGSMHLVDVGAGFMGSTPIVGGTVPLATGMAWAQKLQCSDAISVAFFGDGCFEEGVVHESLNFAALHRLPLIFICENNEFSVYTHLRERQPRRAIHEVAAAHGWSAHHGDGNDALGVHTATVAAVERARGGGGPQFLEFSTYRWREHCGPDFDEHLGYRSETAIASGRAACPIERLRRGLSLSDADQQAMEDCIRQEITGAFEFALASPAPTPEDARNSLYAV